MEIQYEYSELSEFYCKLTLGNSSVAVDGVRDGSEWEITDCFNGKQLASRRLTGREFIAAVWPELMIKAHHLLLELHRQAEEQAALDKDFFGLYQEMQEKLASMTHLNEQTGYTGMTMMQLQWMKKAVELVSEAYELIDDVQDPPENKEG